MKKTKEKNIKESILSYFKLKKEEKDIDISPKSIKTIPQIIPPLVKNNKRKEREMQYISPDFNILINGLNKKINSIGKLPIKNIYKKIVYNNINNNYKTNPTTKEITNKNSIVQKINSPQGEINNIIPKILNAEELKQNKNTKPPKQNSYYNESNIIDKTENIINNINKTLLTNTESKNDKVPKINKIQNTESKNDKVPKINKIQNTESKNDKVPEINKIQNNQITNNTINKDESNTIKEIPILTENVMVNNNNTKQANSNHKAISKVLNRSTNTDHITNKKSYLISTSTINKILSGKVHVPQTIPAYAEGGPVPQKHGGQLIVAGEKENETVIPDSKIGKSSTQPAIVEKTNNETASSAASTSLDKNAALKMNDNEKSSGDSAGGNPTVVNATASSSPTPAPAPSMGGSPKSVTNMRAQTMYPRWRQSMG